MPRASTPRGALGRTRPQLALDPARSHRVATLDRMHFDPTPLIGGSIIAIVLLGLLYLVLAAALMAFGLWLTYTVIWRAVRRGMREYHGLGPVKTRHGRGPTPYS